MKMKTVHNPIEKDIENYRIEEADPGTDGEVVYLTDGSYKKTGNTLEWSITAGQTLEFPGYVADYLKDVYDFLEIKKDKEAVVIEEEPKSTEGTSGVVCRHCGKTYTSARGLGLHIAAKHPEKL